MAFVHGKGSVALKDGFNLSDYLQSINIPIAIDEVETTVLSDLLSKTFMQGLESVTIEGEGLFDGATSAVDEELNGAFKDTANVWTVFPNADTFDNIGWGVSGIDTAYTITTTFDDAVKISLSGRGNTARENITSLIPLSTLATTDVTTGSDNSASSANGGVGYIHVTAVTGTVEVILEHSTDDASYSTLGSFTAVDTANTAERITFSSTVNRYVRASYTVGGGESITCQVSFGRL